MSDLLTARGVEVSFGARTVLRGVDLRVANEESVAIIGANGAGKTTLMKVLAGVLAPEAGEVRLGGERLEELPRREVARRLAVVPQGTPQVFAYTVLEFVLMGNYASRGWLVPSQEQIDGARRALTELKMEPLAEQAVSHLSGGELQRALMARAMVSEVDLWLLDEPVASLDMRHRNRVLRQIEEHAREGGAAVAVLHELDLVHRYFDRVIALDGGVSRVDGPPDEVLTPEVVSSVYGVEMERGQVHDKVVWVVEGG